MEPIIKIENLAKEYLEEDGTKTPALKNVSLEVYRGEFLAITGPSGCGKSTLLRCIAGLIKPDRGRILIAGRGPEDSRNKLAMVFQDFALFGWLTALDNAAFGLKMRGVSSKVARKLAAEKLEVMGLKGFEKEYPDELSIGMRQRVGLARALAVDPEVLLMDEPFSSLDAFTAEKLRKDLLKVWLEENEREPGNMTIVMVTHLVDEAVEMADRVVVLTPRPAEVERIFENKLPRPRNNRSEDFRALAELITGAVAL